MSNPPPPATPGRWPTTAWAVAIAGSIAVLVLAIGIAALILYDRGESCDDWADKMIRSIETGEELSDACREQMGRDLREVADNN